MDAEIDADIFIHMHVLLQIASNQPLLLAALLHMYTVAIIHVLSNYNYLTPLSKCN